MRVLTEICKCPQLDVVSFLVLSLAISGLQIMKYFSHKHKLHHFLLMLEYDLTCSLNGGRRNKGDLYICMYIYISIYRINKYAYIIYNLYIYIYIYTN